jgi:acid phosphatase (class A)
MKPKFSFLKSLLYSCLASWLVIGTPLRATDETMDQPETLVQSRQLHFLAPDAVSAATLLCPPPLPDSAEQAADLEEVRAVYHAASDADKQAGYSEKKFSVFNFAGVVGSFFVATNLPKTAAFFVKVQQDAETVTDAGKNYFKRPRPYTVDTNLANGKLETSFSYPSGHSTESMVLGLVLAEALSDQHDAIIAKARSIGWHRVEIARHYATDIYAGRTLAKAIVREMKKNQGFQQELSEAKAEIAAAKK